MTDKIRLAYLAFHISAAIYVLLALAAVGGLVFISTLNLNAFDQLLIQAMIGCFALFCIAIAVFVEIVVSALKRNRFWAWVAGLVISGLYVPSLFLPLGVMGLVGLLDENVRTRFNKN